MKTSRIAAWLAVFLFIGVVASCATLPDVGAEVPPDKDHPTVATANGQLPTKQAKELLARR